MDRDTRLAQRLLLVGSQMETGGAQTVTLTQAQWFDQQGARVVLAFLYDKEGLQTRWEEQIAMPIVNLRARKPGGSPITNLFALLGGMARLLRLMQSTRFDAVQAVTHRPNLITLPLAWLAGVPVRVATHHGVIQDFPPILEKLHTLMVNSNIVTHCVVVSEKLAQVCITNGINPEKIVVIHNGVDPRPPVSTRREVRAALGVENDSPVVFTAGRMTHQKAHTHLLRAFKQVLDQYPTARLWLAGDGPLRDNLTYEANQLGIREQVDFLGIRKDVPDLMAAADIFALSSISEGLPMVVIEAMAAGLPVVSTDVKIDELVRHGQTGLIVPREDPTALAEALMTLLKDDRMRSVMANEGARMAKARLSTRAMCVQYAQMMFGQGFPLPPDRDTEGGAS